MSHWVPPVRQGGQRPGAKLTCCCVHLLMRGSLSASPAMPCGNTAPPAPRWLCGEIGQGSQSAWVLPGTFSLRNTEQRVPGCRVALRVTRENVCEAGGRLIAAAGCQIFLVGNCICEDRWLLWSRK